MSNGAGHARVVCRSRISSKYARVLTRFRERLRARAGVRLERAVLVAKGVDDIPLAGRERVVAVGRPGDHGDRGRLSHPADAAFNRKHDDAGGRHALSFPDEHRGRGRHRATGRAWTDAVARAGVARGGQNERRRHQDQRDRVPLHILIRRIRRADRLRRIIRPLHPMAIFSRRVFILVAVSARSRGAGSRMGQTDTGAGSGSLARRVHASLAATRGTKQPRCAGWKDLLHCAHLRRGEHPASRKARPGTRRGFDAGASRARSAIIEWWYTGAYTVGGERRLATHTGALMWAALGMPAPGTCTGSFGAWSRPPRTIA